MKIKKHLLPLIVITVFFVSSVAAHADKGGKGGKGGDEGIGSPEPAAVVTFFALAGVALVLRRKFSKDA